jgi:hypothetical protein
MAAKRAQSAIEDFVNNPPAGSVLSGPADAAAQTLAEARGNYAAGRRGSSSTNIVAPSGPKFGPRNT